MSITRRCLMKIFGTSVASLMMTRCRVAPPIPTCYAPMPPTDLPPTTARERLRWCWQRFGELAQAASDQAGQGDDSGKDTLGRQMVSDHRDGLDELVAAGEITPTIADLVHESYGAAVYHVGERAYYTLDPLGNLRPCNHSDLILGNLFERSFPEIIALERMQAFIEARPALCDPCPKRNECQGGCKAAAQVCTGSLSAEDPFLYHNRGEYRAIPGI